MQTTQELSIEMTDDKALTGGQEKIVRTVERTLAAQARRDQPGVKITNLASGKTQVEVHAYDDDLHAAGDAAREEFNRQLGLESVPAAELERMRWLASIGQAAMDRGFVTNDHDQYLAERDTRLPEVPEPIADEFPGKPHDIPAGPGHRVRRPVQAVGDSSDDLMSKLKAVTEGDGDA